MKKSQIRAMCFAASIAAIITGFYRTTLADPPLQVPNGGDASPATGPDGTEAAPHAPDGLTNNSIAMGVQELTNKTTVSTWDKGAISVGQNPEMKGKVRNKTGAPIDDITIKIENHGAGAGSPPTAVCATVKGGGNSSASGYFSGGMATINFGDGTGGSPGPLADGNSFELELELSDQGTEPPTDFKVKITASVKDKPKGSGVHADFYGWFNLDTGTPGLTKELLVHGHDRIAVRIKNVDETYAIQEITGTMTLPGGLIIAAVHLQDPDNDFNAVPGASISVTQSSFQITGIALAAADNYELVVVLSGSPGAETSRLEINVEHQE